VEHEGETFGGAEGIEHEQEGWAHHVGEDRLFLRVEAFGYRAFGLDRHFPATAAGARHPGADAGRTVVSHLPRLSMRSASDPLRRIQVSCTASSASVSDPNIR
jgi:hypothetical protein